MIFEDVDELRKIWLNLDFDCKNLDAAIRIQNSIQKRADLFQFLDTKIEQHDQARDNYLKRAKDWYIA